MEEKNTLNFTEATKPPVRKIDVNNIDYVQRIFITEEIKCYSVPFLEKIAVGNGRKLFIIECTFKRKENMHYGGCFD